ncbi:MAG: polysaccharide biosynthesis tyrosine autokinase [Alphaproteobacteria bacterium]|nr:polysaccharide biosynthesis tyrosine autokinase [Alphaproteobacteria bacterium]
MTRRILQPVPAGPGGPRPLVQGETNPSLPRVPPPLPESIGPAGVARVLWRGRWLIAGGAVLAGLAAAAALQLVTPRYAAQGMLVIESQRLNIPELQGAVADATLDSAIVRSEVQILRSRALVAAVAQSLALDRRPEFNPPPDADGTTARLWRAALARLPTAWRERIETMEGGTEAPSEPPSSQAVEAAVVARVQGDLAVSNDGRSHIVSVEFLGEDPELSAAIVNRLMERYIADKTATRSRTNQEASAALGNRLEELRGEVEELDRQVQEYRRRYELVETRLGTVGSQQIADLNTQLTLARAERAQVESRLQAASGVARGPRGAADIQEVLGSPLIVRLREREAEIAQREAEISTRFGPNHPQRRQAQAELAEIRRSLGGEIDKVVGSIRAQFDAARNRERALDRQLAELRERATRATQAESELRQIEKEADARRLLYQSFQQRAELTATATPAQLQSNARIVSAAVAPLRPATPRRALVLPLAALGGALAGCGAALLRTRRDDGFTRLDAVAAATGLPGLAAIPRLPGRKLRASPARVVVEDPASPVAETLRGLRARLRLGARGGPRVVLVASALDGEGKSSIAAALARIGALDGLRTLLIEGDLRRPSIAQLLGRGLQGGGLERALAAPDALAEATTFDLPTGLSVLAAAAAIDAPHRALAEPTLRELLAGARASFDLVVVDAPPVMLVSDAILIAEHCDAIVLVVESERTARSLVSEAVARLASAGRPIAGVVLSKSAKLQVGGGYYGGYAARA